MKLRPKPELFIFNLYCLNSRTITINAVNEVLHMIEIPFKLIELEHENYHILLEGMFSDGTTANWIIDTGASKSVLDVNLTSFFEKTESENEDDYQSAGINQGMTETSVGRMFHLQFGSLIISDHKVALIDLDHVNEIYGKYTSYRIAGLLGGDILMHYRCTIDYSTQTICFRNSYE